MDALTEPIERVVEAGEWFEHATLLEAFAGRGLINKKSIKRWDDGKKISEAERDAIIERVSTALRQAGNTEIRVV